jgi:hypothetical protein
VELAGLAEGTYSATITVKLGDVEKTIPIAATVEPAAPGPAVEDGQPQPPPTCGVGFCGSGGAGMMPLMLVGLACMKLSFARRSIVSVASRRHGALHEPAGDSQERRSPGMG